MSDTFQRLLTMSATQPLALNAQAALGVERAPQRSQFSLLVRHFLERFFNHETASPDGDAKTRLIQIAFAAGMPGFVVAIYLWPVYHPIPGWPPGSHAAVGPPAYWIQVNHHFFYVVYSFVVMGIVTVFEWDMFFPDLLDLWVLKSLPIPDRRAFAARVAAIAIFVAGFLFDINLFSALVLPAATDPPNLPRFFAGHALAVIGSGLFAATFILAMQGVLLSLLGERFFRKISLVLQSLSITALLLLMFLLPVFSWVIPTLLKSGSSFVLFCPPLWFLGVYQYLLEGQAGLPIYSRLAAMGGSAMLIVGGLAVLTYPLAYLRRVRQLVEGPGARSTRSWFRRPLDRLLNFTVARAPIRRAVFHFISQTVLRVPRYRIHLVLYGGVGLSLVATAILRFGVEHHSVRVVVSPDGIRSALGIVAFWVIAGLRMAFVSSGNRQGNWAFRIVHGTLSTGLALRTISPAELLTWPATIAQVIVAGGMCLLLTDALFLSVTTIAFTGEPTRDQPNLAFTVLKYYTAFPLLAALPIATEWWIEKSFQHMFIAALVIAVSHLVLGHRHRNLVRQNCNLPELEDGEEDFPMKLGLRD
jgi:hypothetical protein